MTLTQSDPHCVDGRLHLVHHVHDEEGDLITTVTDSSRH